MRLYVIGPVTGMPDLNVLEFDDARDDLERHGHDVEIPHDTVPEDAEWNEAMRLSIARMLQCDGVAMLDGWEGSRGATMEHAVAMAVRMPARTVRGWLR